MTLVNHSKYEPTPRDMMMALAKLAEQIKAQTGKLPSINVGVNKVFPPVEGQPPMDKKMAVKTFEALYGQKGTIVVKDDKTPVFKQVNGAISNNKFNIDGAAPDITPKEKYEQLLNSNAPTKAPVSTEELLVAPVSEQKAADTIVQDVAKKQDLPPEEVTQIIAQGSGFVQTNLDVKLEGEGPKISPGLQYLAKLDTEYRKGPEVKPEQKMDDLVAQIDSLKSEIDSMKATMTKIANQEPIPFLKQWAKNKIDTTIARVQDRAKINMVKTVNFGKDMAQKAMDKIGEKAGMFQQSMLNVDNVSKNLTTMFEIHDNSPVVAEGDYTFKNNDGGVITVTHKDRGEVFSASEKGAKFKGNVDDYQMLSKMGEVVNALAGPAAIAAEVVKELATQGVKESSKTAALKV
jgi:hypothetical protein